MKRFWISIIFLLVGQSIFAGVINVDFEAGMGQRNVVDSMLAPLMDGNQVNIGFFNGGFDVAANAGDLSALDSAWKSFASTDTKTVMGGGGPFR